jgi:branched-chain amino acid transport system substrate-binding protein
MPGGPGFSQRFNARFGKIQIYAPFSYDATRALVAAMRRAGSAEPGAYLPDLGRLELEGVIGPIAFDENGDLRNGPVTLYRVQGGAWVPLETVGGQTP